MPKKADEVTTLSEELLRLLESRRDLGGESYPPTLRRLAELCGGSPSHEQIVKAVGKKAFSSRAVVPEKVEGKPSLDSPVYFKEDAPAKPKRASSGGKGDGGVAELAERMLLVLEEQRRLGGEAYPPTLRRLAELCGGAGSEDQVLKAIGKKTFTSRAVVTKKVDKVPAFDSPVFFKEDVRKPDPVKELAERMVLVLESQRRLGGEAYPPTLRRLAELCERNASDTLVPKAAGHEVMAQRAIVVAKAKSKPSLDAPVVLKEDVEDGLAAVLPALLRFALSPVTAAVKKKKVETNAFTLTELTKRITALKGSFGKAVERGIEQQDLPPDVAWVVIKGEPKLFLVENLRPTPRSPLPADGHTPLPSPIPEAVLPAPERPPRDFAEAFCEAFEQLDRRNGLTNFVKLADLRHALSEFSREEFDAGLRKLRLDGEFSLDSHEGLYGTLTPEEREAGVHEAGSLLIYASKR